MGLVRPGGGGWAAGVPLARGALAASCDWAGGWARMAGLPGPRLAARLRTPAADWAGLAQAGRGTARAGPDEGGGPRAAAQAIQGQDAQRTVAHSPRGRLH